VVRGRLDVDPAGLPVDQFIVALVTVEVGDWLPAGRIGSGVIGQDLVTDAELVMGDPTPVTGEGFPSVATFGEAPALSYSVISKGG
jgi:hypothetical protein